MKYCRYCGTAMDETAPCCPACGTINEAKEMFLSVEKIEKMVEKHYNERNALSEDMGAYVVLHTDTVVCDDICKVVVRLRTDADDPNTFVPVADASVNMRTGQCDIHSRQVKPKSVEKDYETPMAYIVGCVTLMLLGIILWFAAPYLGSEYSSICAIEVLGEIEMDEILKYSPQGQAHAFSVIALSIGVWGSLLTVCFGKWEATTTISIIAAVISIMTALANIIDQESEITYMFGFWGMVAILVAVACISVLIPSKRGKNSEGGQ